MKHLLFLTLSVLLVACTPKPNEDIIVDGMQPIYIQQNNFEEIFSEGPKAFERVGKIYKQGNFLLISDIGTGVHVINNSNPSAPEKIAFINIPGNHDMLARLSAMYADNGNDLVTLDISDLNDVYVVDRIENVYPVPLEQSPPNYTGHFECVDPANGIVVGWREVELTNPKCSK